MIISMYKLMCVTNRKLCKGNFLKKIEEIANTHPAGIILREKDLPETEYRVLAKEVMRICKGQGTLCILHNFEMTAKNLGCDALHLPLPKLRSLTKEERKSFRILGTSCHSVEEAKEAQELNCTYIIAGHVFATDCKKDMPPRGLEFLKDVCESVEIPVWGIGGISMENIEKVCGAGAEGGCIMSGFMK